MTTQRPRYVACLLLALLAFSGCERGADEQAKASLRSGFWTAHITLPGGNIDTGFEISHDGEKHQASFVSGRERFRVGNVQFTDNVLVMSFPAFGNEIRARLDDDSLSGELTLSTGDDGYESMPFTATHGSVSDDPQSGGSSMDLSGRWNVEFEEQDGTTTSSVVEFAQRGSRLFGTFVNPDSEYRFLAGHVRGSRFKLSAFDGANAYLFAGTIDGNRITDADFWSGTHWHQRWSAARISKTSR
ncbi:MAG: hypothetical protein WD078_00835 [Woeseia sp.]